MHPLSPDGAGSPATWAKGLAAEPLDPEAGVGSQAIGGPGSLKTGALEAQKGVLGTGVIATQKEVPKSGAPEALESAAPVVQARDPLSAGPMVLEEALET